MHNKKHLVIITESFPRTDCVYSGEFVLQQVLELAKLGYKVTVLFPKTAFPFIYKLIEKCKGNDFFVPKKIDGLLPDNIKFYFVPFPYYTKFGLKDLLKALGIFIFIKTKKLKVDLIHGHVVYDTGYLSVMIAKWLKKPVIITAHGSDINALFMEHPEVDRLYFTYQSLEEVKRKVIHTLKECHKVIAVSNALKERIIKLGIPHHKIHRIYNGVNITKFYPASQKKARLKLKLPTDKKIILFVGNLIKLKGLFDLITALDSIKEKKQDFLCVIIGKGPLKEKLIKQIKSRQLENNVLFTGQISNHELPLWYNASDVFCLPSYCEGFGCVLTEAMACGKPLVATSVGGIPEIINDPEVGFLVPPQNPTKLTEALLSALDKKWDTEHIRSSSERFYWSNIIPQIKAAYTEALETPVVPDTAYEPAYTTLLDRLVYTEVANKPLPIEFLDQLMNTDISSKPIPIKLLGKPAFTELLDKPTDTQVAKEPVYTQLLYETSETEVADKPA